MKQRIFERGGRLTAADTEGNEDIWQCMVVMLHKAWAEIDRRFGYLNVLPWAFATADTIKGALHVMTLLRARPMAQQDPYTRILADRIGGDVEKRSRGEPASDNLRSEVKTLKMHPLSESLGEGYHRGTNLEKKASRCKLAAPL